MRDGGWGEGVRIEPEGVRDVCEKRKVEIRKAEMGPQDHGTAGLSERLKTLKVEISGEQGAGSVGRWESAERGCE